MADTHNPAADDLMSLIRKATPTSTHIVAVEPGAPPTDDVSLAETCAGLQKALDSEGSGSIEIVDAELDSLLAGLEVDSPPSAVQQPSDSGLIVFADVLAE